MAQANENYVLGRGEIHFRKSGDTSFRFLGNAPAFNLSVTSEKLEHFRSTRGVREKDRTIILQTNRTATITAEDISIENLALFFLGSTGIVAQTALTAQTQTFAAVAPGRLYQVGESPQRPTGHRKLTGFSLSKGGVPLVALTDYTVDLDRGFFEILTTGTVVAGDSLTAAFGVAANARKQVISGSDSVTGAMKFISYPAEGDPVDYFLPAVEISPNGDFALISENALQTLPLTVDVQTTGNLAAVYADGAPYVPA